jgi:hypothetical protein
MTLTRSRHRHHGKGKPLIDVTYGLGLQVFGNSIAAGANAPAGGGYANRVASWIGGGIDNKAVGGTGVRSITEQGNLYLPYGPRQKLVIWDGPLNDLRAGAGGALACIAPSMNAFLSSAFMGGGRGASHSQVTKTGVWTAFSDYGGRAYKIGAGNTPMQSADPNATLTYTTPATKTVSVHSFMTEATGTLRDLEIDIDGDTYSLPLGGKARIADVACGAALLVKGLDNVPHTVTIRSCSTGTKTVVDCIAWPYIPGMAPVLMGHIPYQKIWNAYTSVLNNDPLSPNYGPALVDQANLIIDGVVDEWSCAGFPVRSVPVGNFYNAMADCDVDGIHPHTIGHLNYACAYMSEIHVL